jgi:subtilisin family serine protease
LTKNKKGLFTSILVVALTLQAMAGDWSYYRSDGSRYYLAPCDSLVTIRFVDENPADTVMTTLQMATALEDDYDPVDVGFALWQFALEPGADLDTLIADLLRIPEVRLVNPVFLLDNGKLMYASDQIILRAKSTATQQEIDSLFGAYDLAIAASPDAVVPFYVVALTGASPQSLFDVADALFESDLCRCCNPNFYGDLDEPAVLPNDTYYPWQWHLSHPDSLSGRPGADIDMEEAWEYDVGDTGTVIGIIDYAFDIDHVDLGIEKMFAPYDAVGEDYEKPVPDFDPRLPEDEWQYDPFFWHGTACLGMFRSITDNDAGIASPGRNFYFMPIKSYDNQKRRDEYAAARAWAWAIFLDVEAISFSISYGSNLESVNTLFEDARERGIPIFCAAGNRPEAATHKPVCYPANMPQVMAVGATDIFDEVTGFSARGPELELVAPGQDLYTLDVTGDNGYNRLLHNPCDIDMDYTCNFTGTSAAAPLAAGVAALVLSRMPGLKCMGQDSIYSVLRHSADDQISVFDPPGYDTTHGWGRLNAARALLSVVRGDVDKNGIVNISDAVYIQNYIFADGPPPLPVKGTADANCDGIVNVSDEIYLIGYIFGGGPPPQAPCHRFDY